MSMNRQCRDCDELEDIRFNFGDDREAEREFHSQTYLCQECLENEWFINKLETMPTKEIVETLEKVINELKNKKQ